MHASCKLWLTETAQNSTLPRGQSQLTRIITRKHACTCNCSAARLRTQCTLLIVSRASTATVAHNLCSQLPRVGATLVRCHMHALFALLNQSCLVSMGSSPCSALHCSTSPDWPAWAQPHALLCSHAMRAHTTACIVMHAQLHSTMLLRKLLLHWRAHPASWGSCAPCVHAGHN